MGDVKVGECKLYLLGRKGLGDCLAREGQKRVGKEAWVQCKQSNLAAPMTRSDHQVGAVQQGG